MNAPRKTAAGSAPAGSSGGRRAASPKDLQPAPTGANRGSPAASVMKQSAKTRAESSGRS